MSFKLFLCKLGLHKWFYYQRKVQHNDSDYFKDATHMIECRRCIKCEKIQQSVHGATWEGKFRIF